jgi:ABC-2 type transport system ATP-binding protein
MHNHAEPVVEVRNLLKHYPKVKAVNGVSFAIHKGQCFGLLGPNGAGKTTTIEMIEGITSPTSGEILFKGSPVTAEFREKIGIQFQSTALPDFLTVKEVLELFQSFYREPKNIHELADLCDLKEFWNQDTHELSGGQRQRVLLAIGLINNPEVVFLDEPTTGLDPQARRNFWNLIQVIKKQNKTIILTTHYMEEAYVLCDEIAIMDKGKIITQGAPNVLLKKHFSGVTLEIPRADFTLAQDRIPKEWRLTEKGEVIEIFTDEVNGTFRTLLDQNISLSHLKIRSQTLEDLFLQLTQ